MIGWVSEDDQNKFDHLKKIYEIIKPIAPCKNHFSVAYMDCKHGKCICADTAAEILDALGLAPKLE